MRRTFLLFTVLLLVLPLVMSAEITVEHSPERAYVFEGEPVQYTLSIHNDNYYDAVDLQVKSLDLHWILEEDFTEVYIEPRATETLVVNYNPLSGVVPDDYGINLVLTDLVDDSRTEMYLPVRVMTGQEVFVVQFLTDGVVDPRHGSILKVSLANTADRDFNDVSVTIASDFFEETRVVSVAGYEDALVAFPVDLPDTAHVGEYPVTITLDYDGGELGVYESVMDVSQYGDLTEVSIDSSSFLKSIRGVTQTNDGNSEYHSSYVMRYTLLERMFTSYLHEPDSLDRVDGQYKASWDVVLLPGESITIESETNYRFAVCVLLVLLVLSFGWYYFTRRSISVSKKVASVQPKKGKLAKLKVTLVVKNTSSRPLKGVKLMDRVPNTSVAPAHYSTLRPKVKKGAKSVTLLWDLPTLKGGEERVITYEVKSALHFSGKLILPSAVARYREGGKQQFSQSNTCTISEK